MTRQYSFTTPYEPYNDNFSSDYYPQKILFQQGHKIDNTHLNLLQTIIQEQIGQFGSHIFTNGSFVTGGQYTLINGATILNISSLKSNSIELLESVAIENWSIKNTDQIIKISHLDLDLENSTEVHKLIVSKDTPFSFQPGNKYTIVNQRNTEIELEVVVAVETKFIVFDAGVLFINGYFISTPLQHVIIRNQNSVVGFLLKQNIISAFDDPSLLENSQSALSSFEGADRLQLLLRLVAYSIEETNPNYLISKGSFYEFLRLENGLVIKDLTKTQYAKEFDQMIDRRTYDKSGNYTINPFKIDISEFSDNIFKVQLSPGKAYIFGNEFETLSNTNIFLNKSSFVSVGQTNKFTIPELSYFLCPTILNYFRFNSDTTIKLFDLDNFEIGEALLSYIKPIDNKFRFYFSSFTLNGNHTIQEVAKITNTEYLDLAPVTAVYLRTAGTRVITLDTDERISTISKLENLSTIRTFEEVTYNFMFFDGVETPSTVLSDYITFNSSGQLCFASDVIVEEKKVTFVSQETISKVIATNIKRSITNVVAVETENSVQVPFNTTLFFPFRILKVISAFNNQENIVADFELSEVATRFRLQGTQLQYIKSTPRSGNVLFKFLVQNLIEENIRFNENTLDLRQSNYSNFPVVEPGTNFDILYDTHQARFVKVVLTKNNTFEFIEGTPHPVKPQIPKDRPDAMTLYTLYVPGNTKSASDIGVQYVENKTYTMRDIGKLEKRIENLEYYNLLSLLEKNTADQNYKDENGLSRFKNGFLVDNFKTYKGANFLSPDCVFSFDLVKGELRPSFTLHNIKSNPLDKSKKLITCDYSETTLIEQNQASTTVNINPYEVFTWEGKVTLTPSLDFWVDTKVKPDINLDHKGEFDVYSTFREKGFTSEWGAWDTKILNITDTDIKNSTDVFNNTEAPITRRLWIPEIDPTATLDLIQKYDMWISTNFSAGFPKSKPDGFVNGKPAILLEFKGQKVEKSADLVHFNESKIISNEIGTTVRNVIFAPYIRPQVIEFLATGLKPNTEFFVLFSEVNVSTLCTPIEPFTSLVSDSNGNLHGNFSLPAEQFKIGKHSFKLIDTLSKNTSQISSFAVTDFTANGMQASSQGAIISTREPQTTKESVKFIESTVAVFDNDILETYKTITIYKNIGVVNLELFEIQKDLVGTVDVIPTPVITMSYEETANKLSTTSPLFVKYYTKKPGGSFKLKISLDKAGDEKFPGRNTTIHVTKATSVLIKSNGKTLVDDDFDHYSFTNYGSVPASTGFKEYTFMFNNDTVISVSTYDVSLHQALDNNRCRVNLVNNNFISAVEMAPYFKVENLFTLQETYLQYRREDSTVVYPSFLTFSNVENTLQTDKFIVANDTILRVSIGTAGTSRNWKIVPSETTQTIPWVYYPIRSDSEFFTSCAVTFKNLPHGSPNLIDLFVEYTDAGSVEPPEPPPTSNSIVLMSFNKTKFFAKDTFFIEDVDITSIVETGEFKYKLDESVRKLNPYNLKFSVPFGIPVKIEYKPTTKFNKGIYFKNIEINNTTYDQLKLGELLAEPSLPLTSKIGYLDCSASFISVSFDAIDPYRMTCIPTGAPTENLIPIPMLVQFNDNGSLKNTVKINGVNLSSILYDYNNSPYMFKTAINFIGDKDFRSQIVLGKNYSPSVLKLGTVASEVTGPSTSVYQAFILWYIPMNSLFTIDIPYFIDSPKILDTSSFSTSKTFSYIHQNIAGETPITFSFTLSGDSLKQEPDGIFSVPTKQVYSDFSREQSFIASRKLGGLVFNFLDYTIPTVEISKPTLPTLASLSTEPIYWYVPKVNLRNQENSFKIDVFLSGNFSQIVPKSGNVSLSNYFYTRNLSDLNNYLTILENSKYSISFDLVVILGGLSGDYFIKEITPTTLPITESILENLPTQTELNGFTTLRSVTRKVESKVNLADNVGQSFFINDEEFPEGVFLSSIDLYFKTKDNNLPVSLEIRPSVNGYPSAKDIIPFSTSSKLASEIQISEDSKISTNFVFESVVYLIPGEYHLVIQSTSLNYTLWTARLGEYILGDPQNGRVTRNPYVGVLFKSSNSTAWIPDSNADLKFTLYRCKFNLGVTSVDFNSNDYYSNLVKESPLEITTIKPAFSVLEPKRTRFSKSKVQLTKLEENVKKTYDINLNTNYDLDNVCTVSDNTYNSDNIIKHNIDLYTELDHVSPVIDWQKSSYVLVNNLINTVSDLDTTEIESFGGIALARYITKAMQLNQEIPATNLRLEFAANTPMGTSIKVYYRVFNTLHDSNNLSIENKNWIYLNSFKRIPKDKDTFIDAAFETPNPIPYPGISGLTNFDVCQIKLVLDSVNPVFVPRVKDLRLIALSN